MENGTVETRLIAKVVPKPEQKQKVKQLLSEMIAPSRAEAGVRTYDLHETKAGNAFYPDASRECPRPLVVG